MLNIYMSIPLWLKMKETYTIHQLHEDIVSALPEDELLNNFVDWYKSLNPKKLWCIPGYATILFKDKIHINWTVI